MTVHILYLYVSLVCYVLCDTMQSAQFKALHCKPCVRVRARSCDRTSKEAAFSLLKLSTDLNGTNMELIRYSSQKSEECGSNEPVLIGWALLEMLG